LDRRTDVAAAIVLDKQPRETVIQGQRPLDAPPWKWPER
jgi:hypothetical protein